MVAPRSHKCHCKTTEDLTLGSDFGEAGLSKIFLKYWKVNQN